MTETVIAPIPTTYRGYRTRSRLEARWLRFLDAMEIEYRYEQEGYPLPSGWYLPDLFIPQIRMWGEVKPEDLSAAEKEKCKELTDATGHPVLLLVGPPDFKVYSAVHSARDPERNYTQRYECHYLLDIHYHGRRFYDGEGRLWCAEGEESIFRFAEDFSREYRQAVHLARSERFDGRAM